MSQSQPTSPPLSQLDANSVAFRKWLQKFFGGIVNEGQAQLFADKAAELFASQPPVGWMPIESAPKDGTSILIGWAGADLMYVSRWLRNQNGWSHPGTSKPLNHPTHWHQLPSLPAPPVAQQERGEG